MHSWPVLVHFCETCQYNTPVEYTSTVWIQDHSCNHCGSSSRGADIAGRAPGTMNRTQHDELVELFAHGMQLTPQEAVEFSPNQPVVEPVAPGHEEKQDAPIHFISSHYTHTGHIRPTAASEPSRSPPPPYDEAIMPEALAAMLRQHSIDPSSLLPNQIHLFTNADYEQRLRLLELWRISPPSYPLEERRAWNHQMSGTSVEQEAAEAKQRYEQQMQARAATRPRRPEEHMFDTYIVDAPLTKPMGMTNEVEPYIMHGYEAVRPPHALDPVYAAAPALWQAPSYAPALDHHHDPHQQQQQQQQHQSAMGEQYGMVHQIRNHADWEQMNQQIARQGFTGRHSALDADDEMVM